MTPNLRLVAENVRLSYGSTVVLPDCTLSFEPGTVTALVGPNGSGKSTLLRGLARLHPLAQGKVGFGNSDGGKDARALSAREFATRLTMLAQHRPTPAGMTVTEAVQLGRYPHRSRLFGQDPGGAAAVDRALTLTSLNGIAHRPIDTLSGGQVQRVWLASCLTQETPVLLLDEPTNHLDLRHQVELLDLVRSLADDHGITVGVVLHDLNHAAAVADTVVILSDGRIVAQGRPDLVLTAELIETVYGVPVEVVIDGERMSISALGGVKRRAVG